MKEEEIKLIIECVKSNQSRTAFSLFEHLKQNNDIRLNTVAFNGPSLETLLKIFELLKLMMLNNDALADRVTYNALFEILANAIDTHPEIEVVNDVSQYCDFLKLVQFQNSLHYY